MNHFSLTIKDLNKISLFIYDGDKLQAIKYYIDLSGHNLQDAKAYIDSLESELNRDTPRRRTIPDSAVSLKEYVIIKTDKDIENILQDLSPEWIVLNFNGNGMGWGSKIKYRNREFYISCDRSDHEINEIFHGHEGETIGPDPSMPSDMGNKAIIINLINKALST